MKGKLEIPQSVCSSDYEKLKGHKGICIWFTGLSGSGKTNISNLLENELHSKKIHTYKLDGDVIRKGLNRDLGFSDYDRSENIRRIGEVAKLFVDSATVVLVSFISPFKEDRKRVRSLFEKGKFIEVYVECGIEECEKRDPKGLYKKARAGKIKDFTGISSGYEVPENPEIVIHNGEGSDLKKNVQKIINYLNINRLLI